jgi:hypothetical protein
MNELQTLFDEIIDQRVTLDVVLRQAIRSKFAATGLALDDGELAEILNDVHNYDSSSTENSEDMDNVYLRIDHENHEIEITEQDVDAAMEVLTADLEDEYSRFIEQASGETLKRIRQDARRTLKANRRTRARFEARLQNRWQTAIDLLELFISLSLEAGSEFNEQYQNAAAEEKDVLFDVLRNLHARACQVAWEVLALIRAGFADGAHSRWRTLHEIAIVAMFIAHHGREVAQRYLDHEFVEAHKAAIEHQRCSEAMRYEPLSDEEFEQIESNYQELIASYDENFRHDYGWAAEALSKKKPTFRDIELAVGLDKWRPYYKMASHNVHAGTKGITFRLGLLSNKPPLLLAGASNTGFTDPAHSTAISLLQVTTTMLVTRPSADASVLCQILQILQDEVGNEFLTIQRSIEAAEKRSKRGKL